MFYGRSGGCPPGQYRRPLIPSFRDKVPTLAGVGPGIYRCLGIYQQVRGDARHVCAGRRSAFARMTGIRCQTDRVRGGIPGTSGRVTGDDYLMAASAHPRVGTVSGWVTFAVPGVWFAIGVFSRDFTDGVVESAQ